MGKHCLAFASNDQRPWARFDGLTRVMRDISFEIVSWSFWLEMH